MALMAEPECAGLMADANFIGVMKRPESRARLLTKPGR
jgi:hypothetical protein